MSDEPLLAVEGLCAYYGSAQCLHDVSFEMGTESVAIIGRNGMGKTTLCAALMGLSPPRTSGSMKFAGKELLGRPSYKIARAGLGYVPQGRRLFPSLTVDEHLKISARNGSESWSVQRVYELFPRWPNAARTEARSSPEASSRCSRSGARCSATRSCLIMDEPSEGLAPAIVDNLVDTFQQLEREGLAILLVEQNLGVAISLAKRLLVMVGGEIAAETSATALEGDVELQRRYLGVEPLAH